MKREMGAWDLAFESILARKGRLTIGKASPSEVMVSGWARGGYRCRIARQGRRGLESPRSFGIDDGGWMPVSPCCQRRLTR